MEINKQPFYKSLELPLRLDLQFFAEGGDGGDGGDSNPQQDSKMEDKVNKTDKATHKGCN